MNRLPDTSAAHVSTHVELWAAGFPCSQLTRNTRTHGFLCDLGRGYARVRWVYFSRTPRILRFQLDRPPEHGGTRLEVSCVPSEIKAIAAWLPRWLRDRSALPDGLELSPDGLRSYVWTAKADAAHREALASANGRRADRLELRRTMDRESHLMRSSR